MDKTNQLGKSLQQIKSDTETALRRDYKDAPLVQRTRDIFDFKVPFNLEFEIPKYMQTTSLNLIFAPPPASPCSGNGCYVGMCEVFLDTNTVLTTTYDYVTSSVIVYNNEIVTTNYTKTGVNEITLGFAPDISDIIKVCYVYYQCTTCGITDTFTRTVGSGWGTSDAGFVWNQSLGSGASASVDGSYGIVSVPQGSVLAQLYFTPSNSFTTWDLYTEFIMPTLPTAIGKWLMYVGAGTPTNFIFEVDVGVGACGYGTSDGWVDLSGSDFTAGTTYSIRLSCDQTTLKMKLWATAGSEPDWQVSGSSVGTLGYLEWRFSGANDSPQPTMTWQIDSLDIPQINSCTE